MTSLQLLLLPMRGALIKLSGSQSQVKMEGQGRSLLDTPTWTVASVTTTMVAVGFLIQGSISGLKKLLIRTKRKALLAALEEIVAEMMVFGLLSLLMGHWTIWFSTICIQRTTFGAGFFACFEEGSVNSTSESAYQFCPEGLQPFASHESLEQLHHFVLVLGIVHVIYSIFIVFVAMHKISGWRTWECQAEGSALDDVKTLIIKHQLSFISQGTTQNKFLLYMICFISQFWRSLSIADYMTLRCCFIKNHMLHVSYNFHKYMLRSMEDEFRDIVRISIPLWSYAIVFILFNVHGTGAYFWFSFIPAALILIIGSKMHYIVMQLALDINNENLCKETQRNPQHELFWFGKPELLLWLIRLSTFQNAFEMATLIWSLWEIKEPSCFMRNHVLVMIRLTSGILFQFWCSYFTFPLYIVTTQMRPKSKSALVAKDIRESVNQWSKRAKYHKLLQSSFTASRTEASSPRPSLDFMGNEEMNHDSSNIILKKYGSSFRNPVFSK